MNPEIRRIEFRGPEFHEWIELRAAILRRPLGLTLTEADIDAEAEQEHLCCFSEGKIIGGLILYQPEGHQLSLSAECVVFKMRQVVVLPEYRGKGIGRKLVQFSEEYIMNKGASHYLLHSREAAVPFYEKLGYQIHGDRFQEIGIPHVLMVKKL